MKRQRRTRDRPKFKRLRNPRIIGEVVLRIYAGEPLRDIALFIQAQGEFSDVKLASLTGNLSRFRQSLPHRLSIISLLRDALKRAKSTLGDSPEMTEALEAIDRLADRFSSESGSIHDFISSHYATDDIRGDALRQSIREMTL